MFLSTAYTESSHTLPWAVMETRHKSYKSLLFARLPKHEIVSQLLQGLPGSALWDVGCACAGSQRQLLPQPDLALLCSGWVCL